METDNNISINDTDIEAVEQAASSKPIRWIGIVAIILFLFSAVGALVLGIFG